MSLMAVKCTNCGKAIQLDDSMESGYCLYCGTKIMVQGQKSSAEKFDVILVGIGTDKINAIKVIREITHVDLREAKDLVDRLPSVVQRGVFYEEAEGSRLKLGGIGAQVKVVTAETQPTLYAKTAENKQVRKDGSIFNKTIIKTFVFWLLVFGLISYWAKYPSALYEKVIYGELIDSSLNSDGTVWLLTDGSIKFNYSVNRINKTKFLFCRTNLYLYDPVRNTVLRTITTNYDDSPPNRIHLCQENNKVWQIGPDTVSAYDSKTGEELQNTDTFIANHKELSPGIANTGFTYFPNTFIIETKDSRRFCYFIDEDLIIPDEANLIAEKVRQHYEKLNLHSVLTMVQESLNSSRERLYSVKGAVSALVDTVMWEHHRFADLNYNELNSNQEISVAPSNSQDIYLEPLILYQDNDIAVIISQKQVGEEADRLLTCVDLTGNKKWVVPQDQLFPELKLRKNNRMDKNALEWILKGERKGNLFVLTFRRCGVIGFDVATGKKLWELQLKDD